MTLENMIGNSPIVKLRSLDKDGNIMLKIEKNNPGGSIKDRPVYSMILAAEKDGRLKGGYSIVEPTSGNTGIAIAMLAKVRGYKAILTMPESASAERIAVMKALGADVVLTPSDKGINGSREKAKEILESKPDCITLDQFSNPANPLSHELTTGPEILRQTNYSLDSFVCGTGTGGTITGVGRILKAFSSKIKLIAVEPEASPVITRGVKGKHKIQGIGPGFIPDVLDLDIVDDVITVSDEEAIEMMKWLHKKEGLLVGISSGANVAAAIRIRKSGVNRLVTVAPDHFERYLSIDY